MATTVEEIQKNHQIAMEEHRIFMRQSRTQTVLSLAISAFFLLLAILVFSGSMPLIPAHLEVPGHVIYALALFGLLTLGLLLMLVHQERNFTRFITMTRGLLIRYYELGQLVEREKKSTGN